MSATTVQLGFLPMAACRAEGGKHLFRERFQRSLISCIQRGFSVEECFGMIWVETWEEISISEQEQSELYDELIRWAKRGAW